MNPRWKIKFKYPEWLDRCDTTLIITIGCSHCNYTFQSRAEIDCKRDDLERIKNKMIQRWNNRYDRQKT